MCYCVHIDSDTSLNKCRSMLEIDDGSDLDRELKQTKLDGFELFGDLLNEQQDKSEVHLGVGQGPVNNTSTGMFSEMASAMGRPEKCELGFLSNVERCCNVV